MHKINNMHMKITGVGTCSFNSSIDKSNTNSEPVQCKAVLLESISMVVDEIIVLEVNFEEFKKQPNRPIIANFNSDEKFTFTNSMILSYG